MCVCSQMHFAMVEYNIFHLLQLRESFFFCRNLEIMLQDGEHMIVYFLLKNFKKFQTLDSEMLAHFPMFLFCSYLGMCVCLYLWI